jgi:hypothetical protein
VRATASDAVAASLSLNDQQMTPAALMTITQKSVGTQGNATYITINANPTAGYFDLLIAAGSTSNVVERYIGVSLNPADPQYLLALVNSPISGSQTVTVTYTSAVSPWTTAQTPAAQSNTPLTGGANGTTGNINLVTTAEQLASIQGIINLNLPGVTTVATVNALTAWAAGLGNVFLVVDCPQASTTYASTVAAYEALAPNAESGTPYTQTSYAAMYGPWLICSDPSALAAGAVRTLPPGGAVLGQYAAIDLAQGPYQVPAGVGTTLSGPVGVDTTFLASDLDALQNDGVNIIRQVPSYGFCIMGARTLTYGMPSRYINIRRTLMYIENTLEQQLQFALFQPNNSTLWSKITAVVTQQLQSMMQAGYFASKSASTAFFVTCDSSNNTPTNQATGVVNVTVGVALSAPAEYVVIDIGLTQEATTVTSTLT